MIWNKISLGKDDDDGYNAFVGDQIVEECGLEKNIFHMMTL